MKNSLYFILLLLSLSIFIGCEEKDKTQLVEVHWDRDMCTRCVMVVSDRKNSVQVKDSKTGKAYMFDDIGCAILWFKEHNITWKNEAMIWVTDVTTGKWIDAKKAFYDTNNITPMAFGFSAHETQNTIKKGEEIITFDEVSQRVLKDATGNSN